MKSRKKYKILTDLYNLLTPLMGKPALLSAVVMTIVFAGLDEPLYACFLWPVLCLVTHVFKKSLQWVVLVSIVVAFVCHEYSVRKNVNDLPEAGAFTEACGLVETTQSKKSGMAIVIQTKQTVAGEPLSPYRVRLTEKRSLPEYPMPGD